MVFFVFLVLLFCVISTQGDSFHTPEALNKEYFTETEKSDLRYAIKRVRDVLINGDNPFDFTMDFKDTVIPMKIVDFLKKNFLDEVINSSVWLKYTTPTQQIKVEWKDYKQYNGYCGTYQPESACTTRGTTLHFQMIREQKE